MTRTLIVFDDVSTTRMREMRKRIKRKRRIKKKKKKKQQRTHTHKCGHLQMFEIGESFLILFRNACSILLSTYNKKKKTPVYILYIVFLNAI